MYQPVPPRPLLLFQLCVQLILAQKLAPLRGGIAFLNRGLDLRAMTGHPLLLIVQLPHGFLNKLISRAIRPPLHVTLDQRLNLGLKSNGHGLCSIIHAAPSIPHSLLIFTPVIRP